MHCNNGYVDACKGCSLQQMKRPQSTSIGSEPLTPTQKRRKEEDHLTKRRKKINFRSSTEWANMLPACQWTPVLAHTSHMYVCMLTWKYCIYWLSHWQAGCDGGRRLWWARPTLRCFFYFRFFEAPPALLCRRANVALQNMCRHTYSRMKGQEKKHENSQVIQLSVDTDVLFCSAHPHRTQRR